MLVSRSEPRLVDRLPLTTAVEPGRAATARALVAPDASDLMSNRAGAFAAANGAPLIQTAGLWSGLSGLVRGRDLGRLTKTSSNTTAAKLNQHLGGKFKGKGLAFVDAAKKHGLDPALLAAIAMHETGNGTSKAVRNKNNPGGLMNPRTNWRTLQRFSTLEKGIDAMARNLKRNYIDKGLKTPAQIGPKYAPVGAHNDPGKLNRHWVGSVSNLMRRLR